MNAQTTLPSISDIINSPKENKYSTSLDVRGYIPVYEYKIGEQTILWDIETKYVYWTSIWKALGRDKLDLAKIIDSNKELTRWAEIVI